MTINETTNRLPDSLWNHTALQSAMQAIRKEAVNFFTKFLQELPQVPIMVLFHASAA